MSCIGYFRQLPTADQLSCQFRDRPIVGLAEGEPLPLPCGNLGQVRIVYSHLLKFDKRGSHYYISTQVGNDGRLDWNPILHGRASQLAVAIGANFSTGS